MLTQKQKDLLMFINARLQDTGVPPSFDEMKDALNLKSKSGIHRLITALEERGFIRRLPHRARALEIIKLPDGTGGFTSTAPHLTVIDGGQDKSVGHPVAPAPTSMVIDSRTVSVPVMGRIAAGVPISAIEDHSRDIACPPDLLTNGEHFALEVNGESMINAGIHDGDTVIIRRSDTAENGDIVVALVRDEEATLKRLRKRGAMVDLEAENPEFETRTLPSNEVRVQGRLVGLIRRY